MYISTGFGSDTYTGSSIEFVPKRYGMDALKIWFKWNFSFSGFGLIYIPIYSVALLYIIIYITKLIKNKNK